MSSVWFGLLAGALYAVFQLGKYLVEKRKGKTGFDAYPEGVRRIEAELQGLSISQAQKQAWHLIDRSPYIVTTPPDGAPAGPAFDQLTTDQRDLLGRYASIGTKEENTRIAAADAAPFEYDPKLIRIGEGELGSDIVVRPGREPVSECDEGEAELEVKSIWHWIIYWHLEAELTATCAVKMP